ncbi:MAG: hypothetical protein E6R12_09680 [Sphingomonadales bacterium]|nr:MAG: hypothetical protein E6R12_09680 [Sphingomonadales bacterium]
MLDRIEYALRVHAIAPSTAGRAIAADPRLIFDLRRGRRPSPPMCTRLEVWLSDLEAKGAAC